MDSYDNASQDSVDTAESSRPAQTTYRRTQRLIDPKWQLGIACAVTMLLLGAGALYILCSALLESPKLVAIIGGRGTQLVGLGVDIVYFLSVAAVVQHVIVRLTHSVVGPALVLERGLRAMKDGDFSARLTLRDGDYLTSVADAAQDLNGRLAGQADEVVGIVGLLRTSAKNERDVLAAADRLAKLFGTEPLSGSVEESEPSASDERMAA